MSRTGKLRRLIYSSFLKPLIYFRPRDMRIKDFLDDIFNVDGRYINTYVVREKLKFRATYLHAPLKPNPVNEYVKRRPGHILVAREDDDIPFVVIELIGGTYLNERLYRVDKLLWSKIKSSLICLDHIGWKHSTKNYAIKKNYETLRRNELQEEIARKLTGYMGPGRGDDWVRQQKRQHHPDRGV